LRVAGVLLYEEPQIAVRLFPLVFAVVLPIWAQEEISALANPPTINAWQRAHAQDKLELANYSLSGRVDVIAARPNSLCAISTGASAKGVKRTALFYVPVVSAGALPRLPDSGQVDPKLACLMEAIRYEMPAQTPIENVVRDVAVRWGQPNGSPFIKGLPGAGLWKKVTAWHCSGFSIWVAFENGVVVVYALRDMPEDTEQFRGPPFTPFPAIAAARMVEDRSPLAAEMRARSNCEGSRIQPEDPSKAANRLGRWLQFSNELPEEEKAAALLLADEYVACVETSFPSPQLQNLLAKLGAKFETRCPQDGPFYAHNFRARAEPNSESAQIRSLGDFCSLKGRQPWPQLVIAKGESILKQFPEDDGSPYVHYSIARAHAAKLSWAYPNGEVETGGTIPLSGMEMKNEREAAIFHFKAYLSKQNKTPESVFAWREAWRLIAGLPPNRLNFGCGCE
jgi:hypothetical protein